MLLGSSWIFYLLQELYAWLVASTYRWRKHSEYLDGFPVSKTLSSTRWSERYVQFTRWAWDLDKILLCPWTCPWTMISQQTVEMKLRVCNQTWPAGNCHLARSMAHCVVTVSENQSVSSRVQSFIEFSSSPVWILTWICWKPTNQILCMWRKRKIEMQ